MITFYIISTIFTILAILSINLKLLEKFIIFIISLITIYIYYYYWTLYQLKDWSMLILAFFEEFIKITVAIITYGALKYVFQEKKANFLALYLTSAISFGFIELFYYIPIMDTNLSFLLRLIIPISFHSFLALFYIYKAKNKNIKIYMYFVNFVLIILIHYLYNLSTLTDWYTFVAFLFLFLNAFYLMYFINDTQFFKKPFTKFKI